MSGQPRVGAMAAVHTHGVAARLIQGLTLSYYNHLVCIIAIDPDGTVHTLEASPSEGFAPGLLSDYDDYLILDWGLDDVQTAEIVAWWKAHQGTPYGLLDIVAMGATRVGFTAPRLVKRASSDKGMVCSQWGSYGLDHVGVLVPYHPNRGVWAVAPGDLVEAHAIFTDR